MIIKIITKLGQTFVKGDSKLIEEAIAIGYTQLDSEFYDGEEIAVLKRD
ncbi:MAG: hypothetical protein JHC31_14185 [Sulfurihydrogenibium sp.]|jgi:hypothetical protein|nr:hypothetical protein [Sulfurihydrogenibium sp.]